MNAHLPAVFVWEYFPNVVGNSKELLGRKVGGGAPIELLGRDDHVGGEGVRIHSGLEDLRVHARNAERFLQPCHNTRIWLPHIARGWWGWKKGGGGEGAQAQPQLSVCPSRRPPPFLSFLTKLLPLHLQRCRLVTKYMLLVTNYSICNMLYPGSVSDTIGCCYAGSAGIYHLSVQMRAHTYSSLTIDSRPTSYR